MFEVVQTRRSTNFSWSNYIASFCFLFYEFINVFRNIPLDVVKSNKCAGSESHASQTFSSALAFIHTASSASLSKDCRKNFAIMVFSAYIPPLVHHLFLSLLVDSFLPSSNQEHSNNLKAEWVFYLKFVYLLFKITWRQTFFIRLD